ncbi:MAG TPA: glycogen/starch synthase, partial [Kofleriaceae bacterium]|nr:glycogen/starch synthase [Kofleriaceae bacterium]
MNILYVTSEVARYAKTGGLADVSAALPAYLGRAGHDVRVFLPYYSRVDERGAALEACGRMQFAPDVIHANDWQTALAPLTLKVRYSWDRLFERTRTLLAIHNLHYQGTFPAAVVADTGLADAANLFHQDQLREGRLSFLLHGILYADGVATVSPTYAREILTPERGEALDAFLRWDVKRLVGIVNGIDAIEWDPATDK